MAYGNESGLVIVDIVQKVYLFNVASPDLYGAQDPYSRTPRSPTKRTEPYSRDDQRSPSIDQVSHLCLYVDLFFYLIKKIYNINFPINSIYEVKNKS
jgi:hypothetical protein